MLDINLGGVVNGCRSFGRRLVERGTGGHIVNVSSMAAYTPVQSMNAYCTSKAAVYMFSDCLRAELDAAGHRTHDGLPRRDRHQHRAHHADSTSPPPNEALSSARREQTREGFRRRRYGPDKVAKAIVSAVKKNKPIRPVTPEAYFVYGVAHVLPQAMRSTARGKLPVAQPFCAMSSSTANIVRVGTPVPPLPV